MKRNRKILFWFKRLAIVRMTENEEREIWNNDAKREHALNELGVPQIGDAEEVCGQTVYVTERTYSPMHIRHEESGEHVGYAVTLQYSINKPVLSIIKE